jgi:8-amino-7-oxononanoate synthase
MRNIRLFEKVDSYRESLDAKELGIYPFFREIISEQDTEVILKGNRRVLMLGSNSYLGLTNHPEVKAAAIQAVSKYGTGCAGSRFLNGTLDIHEELEGELAAWVKKDAAMLYSTGFQVNQGVIAAMAGRRDHVVMDKLNHASLIDGGILSTAKLHRYPHNQMEKLEEILSAVPADSGIFIVTEGVFSMDGDIVDLPAVVGLAEKYGAAIMLDDAHSLGVLGEQGSGTASRFGLTEHIDFIMGTFSKSLASIGGFVASDAQSIEYLRHRSRSFIFSASMPPASAAAVLAALKIIKREPERVARLWKNTEQMRQGLKSLGFNTGLSQTPIIPVHVGDVLTLARMNKKLEDEGIFVNPVVPPAVPPTDCLIRISLMATHTSEQIGTALEKLEKVGREFGVI